MNGSSNGVGRSHSDLSSKEIVKATEGWLELFLTPNEKRHFLHWQEVVKDKSLVKAATTGFFEWLALRLPDNLAPGLVVLTGMLSLGQAWYLTYNYGNDYPVACTWLAAGNVFLFWLLNSVYSIHADRIRQHTSLTDLFKYACDMGSTVWLALLTVYCLGGTRIETQWYAVQACQLVLFLKHLSAYNRSAGLRYRLGAGPGEVLLAAMSLLCLRATMGLQYLTDVYDHVVGKLFEYRDAEVMTGDEMIRVAYYGLFAAAIVQVFRLPKVHSWTRYGLITSLLMRLLPALLLHSDVTDVTTMDVVCDGFFLAVLTSDLTLAKMAGRELHPWVILMSLAAVLSYTVILTLVAVYYIAVFADLCFYMNLPLLATCRNVYCDGVYDLCHIGHKRAFQNALALGNRLLVGVIGDEDASKYKRPPIMTHAERCAEVEACKAVTKVIPNAPCFGLTQEFLDEHQIHVVAFGEEYLDRYPDPKDDPYYGYVRQIGIAYPLPRTNTLSTTDLIKRIQQAQLDKNSPT